MLAPGARAPPGPACYARGGDEATVTDACVVLGYIDPDFFLGGEMSLDGGRAAEVIERDIAGPLGLGLDEAAHAVLDLAIERMVRRDRGNHTQPGDRPRRVP